MIAPRSGRDRPRCWAHPSQPIAVCGSLWHQTVHTAAKVPMKPWVSCVRYTQLKYEPFQKAMLDPKSTLGVSVSGTRTFSNIATMFDAMGSDPADIKMGDPIPYVTDTAARFWVYCKRMHVVVKVDIYLADRAPYLSIEPLVVLPDEPTVYKLGVTIESLFFEVSGLFLF